MPPPDTEPPCPPLTNPTPVSSPFTAEDAGCTGPYTPQEESTALAAGRAPADLPSVAGYDILGVLGRGGMGVVYKAQHLALKRTVALKMIRIGVVPGDEAQARFRAEAEAAARLSHANIVQVFEVGEAGGLPYCALEFLDGGSLSGKLAGTPLPPREAAALVETLARAVQHAHERGIIHRDLKPANILLAVGQAAGLPSGGRPAACPTDGWVPKVSDFGLARRLDEDSGQTQAGTVLGTPSYMAPEQAAGRAREVGPAADTYALGAILYECLTGRPPFKGAAVRETLEQVRAREPVPVRQLQPGCPRDLETVCLKCLEKEPQRRYASAAALADDLRRFLDGRPVVARPVGVAGRLARWGRRNPWVAALLSALSLLLTAVAVGASVAAAHFSRLSGNLEEQLEQTQTAQRQAEAAGVKERAANRRLTQELGNSLLDQSLTPWREGDVFQARNLCEQVPPKARSWEWRYLRRLYSGQAVTCRGHRGVAYAVCFSPQGDVVASGGADGTVRLWDPVLGRQLRALTGHTGSVRDVRFSPDGLLLASACDDHTARVWDAHTGKLLHTLRGHTTPVSAVAWSPDGRRLATEAGDRSVRLWDPGTGAEKTRLVIPHAISGSLAFSPDGRLLAATAGIQVVVWDAGTGQVLRTLSLGIVRFDVLAFSPDSRLLAAGGSGRAICLWEVLSQDTGRKLRTLGGDPARDDQPVGNSVSGLCFRPDGRQLASCCGTLSAAGPQRILPDGTFRVWDVDSGREVFSCGAHLERVVAVSYSPDGRWLASAGVTGEVRVWDMRTPPERQPAPGAPTPVHAVCFSPDGRRLASASGIQLLPTNPGQVTIWDAASETPGLVLRHPSPVRSVTFSPTGEFLASGDLKGMIRLWDVRPGASPSPQPLSPEGRGVGVRGRQVRTFTGHKLGVESVCFSPDGRLLASGGWDQTVRLWEVSSGRLLRTYQRPGHVLSVCFDRTGRLAAGGGKTAGDVVLWDRDGRELRRFAGHSRTVFAVCFNRDGTLLASGGADRVVRVWEADSGRELHALTGHTSLVSGVSFSPDGLRLASCDWDRAVRLWDTESGRPVLTLTGPGTRTRGVSFSPDGRRLAAAGGDDTPAIHPGEVHVWDAGRPRPGIRLTGHDSPVSAVWFSGSRVLARSAAGRVRAWSVPGGEPLGEVKETAPPGAGRVAERSDGAFRATGFQDHTVYLVDLRETDEERQERRLAARPDPEWHLDQTRRRQGHTPPDFARAFHARWGLRSAPDSPELLRVGVEAMKGWAGELRARGDPSAAALEAEARNLCLRLAALGPADVLTRGLVLDGLLGPTWTVLRPAALTSAGGATLQLRQDGAILAGGKNPDHDTYTLTARTELAGITGFRLEVIPDRAFRGLPGRAPANGNFELSEFSVRAAPLGEPGASVPVPLVASWCSYSAPASAHYLKKDMRVEWAIDGDQGTYWNTFPQLRQPHSAYFEARGPVGKAGGVVLTFRLDFRGPHVQHALGCFRLSVTTTPRPAAAERWRSVLAGKADTRTVLAAAAYLRGDWKAVAEACEKAAMRGGSPYAACLLAVARGRLGERGAARAALERARSLLKGKPGNALLAKLMREAEGLLSAAPRERSPGQEQ